MVNGEESNKELNSSKCFTIHAVDASSNLTNVSLKESKIPDVKEVCDNPESSICIDSGYETRKVDSWCRICQEAKSDTLISPCKCRGTQGLIHISCLEHWLQVSGLSACEVCSTPYIIHTVPKHSPLVSISIWLFKGGNKK
ncbi:E3 ubiquitin-protein ligase MARCHF8 isoform X2 [Nilaparvata lugens]|uniref:E3 ubiquitin-protein ligase MARCHF8 isoform X2 n=1 Tax=Nilaparvata lugens TaxID=108931 RepID=UPI00193D1B7F|nr:E3 ubiquitin-protein ligase MARCHF8 isoform X2 [Nilaparvata lugens]